AYRCPVGQSAVHHHGRLALGPVLAAGPPHLQRQPPPAQRRRNHAGRRLAVLTAWGRPSRVHWSPKGASDDSSEAVVGPPGASITTHVRRARLHPLPRRRNCRGQRLPLPPASWHSWIAIENPMM